MLKFRIRVECPDPDFPLQNTVNTYDEYYEDEHEARAEAIEQFGEGATVEVRELEPR